jgi:peptidoglycan/LPS O-acetylase OafA/YrhL
MNYRQEIDGLRAIAVLPVILFHAGFGIFKGGFIGVDVFFVISGYLITNIMMIKMEQRTFSIANFYESRARRIFPALFLVMFVCLLLGYFSLMPDEYKNFGQSLVATTLFANNILLPLTSGYWSLASEFKPLLHTWSLGVEEQYYAIIPLIFFAAWKTSKKLIPFLLWIFFIASFLFANWLAQNTSPEWAFFLLPTRIWEIALGSIAALCTQPIESNKNSKLYGILSLIGLLLVMLSFFYFDRSMLAPSYIFIVPTFGTVLIITFCRPGSLSYLFLTNKPLVFLGLLSYSLYLWHQPVFAFLRIFSREEPSEILFLIFLPLIFVLSFFTWKFVETPFRDKNVVRNSVFFVFSGLACIFFISSGIFLNKTYGLASRVFDGNTFVQDMDKRIYNEKAFSYKSDSFSLDQRKKILIVGNSFARDFVNITTESFNLKNVEIIYRDDLGHCIGANIGLDQYKFFQVADVIVFAGGAYTRECVENDISFALTNNKNIFYIGTKDFGYNLNWIILLKNQYRYNLYNPISPESFALDMAMSELIPANHYISLLKSTVVAGGIPITDASGHMLSTDRAHLTKYGAIFFGKKVVSETSYSALFE